MIGFELGTSTLTIYDERESLHTNVPLIHGPHKRLEIECEFRGYSFGLT
jgi:hypothetical protein